MPEPLAFRSGKDLGEGTRAEDEDTVTCVDCGVIESDQRAFESGWQLVPAVCPDCLRYTVTDASCCFEGSS